MRIYKRGKYYWVAWPGDDRESTQQTGKEAAERWVKRRELERADPAHAAAKKASVGSLIRAYLDDRRGAGRAPATIEFYEQKLGHVARLFGVDLPLSALTAKGVDDYMATRRTEGASQHTITKEVKALGAAIKKAVRWKWVPAEALTLIPDDLEIGYTPRKTSLTLEELDLLLEELGEVEVHYAAAVAWAVACGPRASEVTRTTRGDIEAALGSGMAHLRGTKTKKSDGSVAVLSIFRPLVAFALAYALPADSRGPETPAFGDWARRRGSSRNAIFRACERARICRVTWNDLRRTHGRILRLAGVSPELIGEQLRHTSAKMAREVYAQLGPAETGALIEAHLCPPAVRTPPDKEGQEGLRRATDRGASNANGSLK